MDIKILQIPQIATIKTKRVSPSPHGPHINLQSKALKASCHSKDVKIVPLMGWNKLSVFFILAIFKNGEPLSIEIGSIIHLLICRCLIPIDPCSVENWVDVRMALYIEPLKLLCHSKDFKIKSLIGWNKLTASIFLPTFKKVELLSITIGSILHFSICHCLIP